MKKFSAQKCDPQRHLFRCINTVNPIPAVVRGEETAAAATRGEKGTVIREGLANGEEEEWGSGRGWKEEGLWIWRKRSRRKVSSMTTI